MSTSLFVEDQVLISGPTFRVELAALDALHPVHYSRRLLIFPCNNLGQRDAQLAALKVGLQALLQRCPILGGIITPMPADEAHTAHENWRTISPGPGLELVIRDLRGKMDSLVELEAVGFSPTQLPYELIMPVPQDIGNDRPFAACNIQFSAIEGGTIIAFAMSHSVADGVGNNELMRILAEETKSAQKGLYDTAEPGSKSLNTIPAMGEDRSFMRNVTSEIHFDINDHPAYMLGVPPSAKGTHPFEATSPELPYLLSISATKLAQLKVDATTPNGPQISTHDALVGLIWRTVLLIRSRRASASMQPVASSTIGDLFMPSDARRQLHLPSSYIGNAVYQLTAAMELEKLFSPSGLRYAATAIRAAITAATPAKVISLMAETNKCWLDWAFLGTYANTGVALGTDWTSGDVYKHDYGKAFGGSMARYRYPDGAMNCIMPKLPDGSAELFVCVMPEEVEVLKGSEGFGKYLDP